MASHDDDGFRVRPAPPRNRTGRGSRRFVSQVLEQVSKSGATASSPAGTRPASTFGRGRVAASIVGRTLNARVRRVVIKSRYVVLKKAGAKSVSTHLRYIERDGVTRDGARGQAYGRDTDAADLKAFEERGRGDRHQFRFIVSVEDAEQLDGLKAYTRELMQRMATDLQTELDWVAVDHWDTDNPHTHVVLRGRASGGQDLVIAPDYMAHGMRIRASELATQWLGPRTELEMRLGLQREIEQERLTSLDRGLLRQAVGGEVDLTKRLRDSEANQAPLRARLQRLEAMGLAQRMDPNRWRLDPGMEAALVAMGERGDILRTMHKALKGEQRECVPGTVLVAPIVGRIAAKGLSDEVRDRGCLVVDGIDGRAHYIKLPATIALEDLPLGAIVMASPVEKARPSDVAIQQMARDGIYRSADHVDAMRAGGDANAEATVARHVRRLEGLRRAGIVERIDEGIWRVPPDLTSRARLHDADRAEAGNIELASHLPVQQQVRAVGATWLDEQLLSGKDAAPTGFGAQVRDAMRERADFLAAQGLVERRGSRLVFARDLLSTLRDRELAEVGARIQQQTGLICRQPRAGERVSGVYKGSLQLTSGRFAMLDDGLGFSLVPWRPVVERRQGQLVAAVVRGNSVTWEFGRQRGASLSI